MASKWSTLLCCPKTVWDFTENTINYVIQTAVAGHLKAFLLRDKIFLLTTILLITNSLSLREWKDGDLDCQGWWMEPLVYMRWDVRSCSLAFLFSFFVYFEAKWGWRERRLNSLPLCFIPSEAGLRCLSDAWDKSISSAISQLLQASPSCVSLWGHVRKMDNREDGNTKSKTSTYRVLQRCLLQWDWINSVINRDRERQG